MYELEIGDMIRLENGTVATVIEQLEINHYQVILRNGRVKTITISDVAEVIDHQFYNMSFY